MKYAILIILFIFPSFSYGQNDVFSFDDYSKKIGLKKLDTVCYFYNYNNLEIIFWKNNNETKYVKIDSNNKVTKENSIKDVSFWDYFFKNSKDIQEQEIKNFRYIDAKDIYVDLTSESDDIIFLKINDEKINIWYSDFLMSEFQTIENIKRRNLNYNYNNKLKVKIFHDNLKKLVEKFK